MFQIKAVLELALARHSGFLMGSFDLGKEGRKSRTTIPFNFIVAATVTL
jgi:hypothetical protein